MEDNDINQGTTTKGKRKRQSIEEEEVEATLINEAGPRSWSRHDDLTSVVLSNNVTIIDERAFYLCRKLKSIVIPPTVASIGDRLQMQKNQNNNHS